MASWPRIALTRAITVAISRLESSDDTIELVQVKGGLHLHVGKGHGGNGQNGGRAG
jgi:hypothetical protein